MGSTVHRFVPAVMVMSLVVTGVAGTASADHDDGAPSDPLATGLVGPLGIDVTKRGDVLVGQAFIGTVSKVGKRGGVTDLASEFAFTPGVAADGRNVLYTRGAGPTDTQLMSLAPDGSTSVLADLGAYEVDNNPDQAQQYGFTSIDPDCADEWPEDFGPPQYTGADAPPDSNPYAIARTRRTIYVADAAANAILAVDRAGNVSTVAVLPPQPAVVDQGAIDSLGLPQCTFGLTYNFEPVPTDVEVHRGHLYATTLPGGPEDPSTGARGAVWKINPRTGHAEQIGAGLAGATDLAVSPSGDVYVTELFAGQVTRIGERGNTPIATLDGAVAVEWAKGKLYVAAGDAVASPDDPLAAGIIVTIHPDDDDDDD